MIALDLPGFGASPMPPWKISIPAYGRFVRDFCERLGIERCALVGNSMGGFIATEVAITEPGAGRRARPRLGGRDHLGARPARAGGDDRPGSAEPRRRSRSASRSPGSAARPSASGPSEGVFHDPDSLRREMLWENFAPALRSPGYFDAITNLVGYDIRHRLEEIERADPDRLGPKRPGGPGPGRALLQEADRRQRRAGDLRPLRARPPDRAAGPLQPGHGGLPERSGSSAHERGSGGPGGAPSEALETPEPRTWPSRRGL